MLSTTTVPAGTPDRFKKGDRVFGYKILQEIGKGGFGRVFLVGRSDRMYVLKVASFDHMDSIFLPRFHEAEIMRRVQRSHVAGVPHLYDAWTHGKHTYLLMDAVHGQSLHSLLDRWTFPLSWPFIRRSMLAMLRILDDLHSLPEPVYHMDATPGNFLVDARGEYILIDFGVAQCKGIAEWEARKKVHFLVGKHGYVPPERMGGGKTDIANPSTDLYSVGVMGFVFLLGRNPFPDYPPICKEHFFLPRFPEEGPRAPVMAIMNKATSWDPADRFQSAREFSNAIRRVR